MIINKDECIACGVCVETCPTKAIDYTNTGKGFQRPEINQSLCMNCGACKEACLNEAIIEED